MSKTKKEIVLKYTLEKGILTFSDPAEGAEKDKIYIVSKNLFENNKEIKEVIFSDLITKIDDNAFKGCTNLEKIKFPKNLKEIGFSAFENCISLKEVTLDKKTKLVKDNAFKNCKKLTSFTAKTNRTTFITLSHNVFNGVNLENLSVRRMDYFYDTFDKNLKRTLKNYESDFINFIDYDIFFAKSPQEAIKSPLETIKIYNAENKTTYTNFIFDLEDDDTFLSAYPHKKNQNLVVVPSGTTGIDGDTFFGNPYIETLILPDTLKEIKRPIANSCDNLRTIIINGECLLNVKDIAVDCKNLESIYMSKECAAKNKISLGSNIYKEYTLDALIDASKSMKEVNKLYKELFLEI